MKAITNFNGTLIVNVKQVQGENTIYCKYTVNGFKSLSINQLVGTLTKQIFKTFGQHKAAKVANGLKASLPVEIVMTDGEGRKIADTANLEVEFAARLTLRSERNFAMALFTGLTALNSKVSLINATEIVDEKSATYINANNEVVWEKEKKVKGKKAAKNATPEVGEVVTAAEIVNAIDENC